jgi:hypothetical protein
MSNSLLTLNHCEQQVQGKSIPGKKIKNATNLHVAFLFVKMNNHLLNSFHRQYQASERNYMAFLPGGKLPKISQPRFG